MKYVIFLPVIAVFSFAAIFGFAGAGVQGEHEAHTGSSFCAAAFAQGSVCPGREDGVAFASFHIGGLRVFTTTIFPSLILLIAALGSLFAVWAIPRLSQVSLILSSSFVPLYQGEHAKWFAQKFRSPTGRART